MELISGTGKLYRVKSGQTAQEVEYALGCPANSCFEGAVIAVERCSVHVAGPFESYKAIAARYGVEEEALKNFNGNRPIYPTCKIYIPI